MKARLLPVTIAAASIMLALKASSLAFGDSKNAGSMQRMPPMPASGQSYPKPLGTKDLALNAPVNKGLNGEVLTGQIAQNTAITEQLQVDEKPNTEFVGESVLAGKETYKADENNPLYYNNETLKAAELEAAEGNSEAKAALLKRMREREAAQNAFKGDTSTQQRLLMAAESKLSDRIEQLKQAEENLSVAVNEKNAQKEAQFAAVVKMYESMKPKNAARIFNTLEMEVLLDVAKRIKPRIMAEIMADMEPSSAQALTIALARGLEINDKPQTTADAQNQMSKDMDANALSNLPKIGG